MNKKLFIAALCLLLTACGKTDTADSASLSGQSSESSAAETSSSGDESALVTVGSCKAVTASKNLLGDDLHSAVVSGAKELYDFAAGAMSGAEILEGISAEKTFAVVFKADDEEYMLSYSADDIFAWARRSDSEVTYFRPDSDTAAQLRDMILAYSALGYILGDSGCTVVPEHTQTSFLSELSDIKSEPYSEARYYYINDVFKKTYVLQTEGEEYFYLQMTEGVAGSADSDDIQAFYEYFTDGKGKAFYRTDTLYKFYTAEEFEGDLEPVPLAENTVGQERYLYSFGVKSDSGEYTVEVWQGEEATDYFLFRNGELIGGWSSREGEGMTVMTEYRTETVMSGEIDGLISAAEENMASDDKATRSQLPRSAEEWIDYDTDKYGLFDLSGGVEVGQEVEPTGVVEEWRRYISSGTQPFTIEVRWAGSYRNEYEICTFDGKDHYYRNDLELHDDNDSTGIEEWYIDGRFFQSVYYTDGREEKEINEWTPDGEVGVPVELLFEDEQRGDDYAGKCERAYEVTVGGEKYICEEWSLMLGRLWKVYIKDGSIVAWEGDFYEDPTVNTVIRLEKTADDSLLKIPEGAKPHVSND